MGNLAQPEPLLVDSPKAAEIVGVSVGVLRGWVRDGLPFIRAGPSCVTHFLGEGFLVAFHPPFQIFSGEMFLAATD